MRLYLVRHGEAKPEREDPERHLSARGREDVRRIARFLKPLGLEVRAIWHSGKPRAEETAIILSESVAARKGLAEKSGLAPEDDVELADDAIGRSGGDLMIVGHLPFMGALAALLLTGKCEVDPIAFPTAAVLCLDRPEPDGLWHVTWMVTPEIVADRKDP
jgi:phosphohistidine phosphatase